MLEILESVLEAKCDVMTPHSWLECMDLNRDLNINVQAPVAITFHPSFAHAAYQLDSALISLDQAKHWTETK